MIGKSMLCITLSCLLGALFLPAQSQAPVPDVAGGWHFVLETSGGPRESDATLARDGDKISGKFGAADVAGTYKDGALELAFPFTSDEVGVTATLSFKGKLEDGVLKGTWQFSEYSGTFTASRKS